MRHELEKANIQILAGLGFFMVLLFLFAIEPQFIGQATTRTGVNISEALPYNCSWATGPGINTISIPCISTAQPFSDVYPSVTGIWAVYQYVPGASDPWKVNNPNLPSYVVSDLTTLSRRAGYVQIMNSSASYLYEGNIVGATTVPFVSGWNLIGYPSNDTRLATASFGSVDASLTEVRTYNNSNSLYESYLPGAGGTLNYTVPGEGYWVNGSASDSWTVVG